MTPILSVSQLQVNYGAIRALKNISFEVHQGEIISLIGANGAGKSTTLRAISGILPFQGNIEFSGKPLKGLKAHEIVRLGIAQSPEGRGVFSNMSVYENLELGAYSRHDKAEIEKDIEHAFVLFPRLKERIKQISGTLSGGEQQMLAIARALMARPKLLLLDEPSLGLAPIIVAQIFEIVKNLNKTGTTILLVEQNAFQALKISDRAYVIETGEITMTGKGSDLLKDESIKKAYLGG